MKQTVFRALNAEERAQRRRRTRLAIAKRDFIKTVVRTEQTPLLSLGRVLKEQCPQLATIDGLKRNATNLIHA